LAYSLCRPAISALIQPIYPQLYNHPDVERYPSVKGVATNLFFLDHNVYETAEGESGLSKSNKHEASFIARLCQHLLFQGPGKKKIEIVWKWGLGWLNFWPLGYTSKQITVLTAYAGQVKLIRSEMRQHDIGNVYVTSVDNYQVSHQTPNNSSAISCTILTWFLFVCLGRGE